MAAPLLIEVILIAALALLLVESDKESVRENRFRQASVHSTQIIQLANEMVIAAFAAYQGSSKVFVHLYDVDLKGIEERKEKLVAVSRGNLEAERAADKLVASVNDLSPLLNELIEPARRGISLIEIAADFRLLQEKFSKKRDINMSRISAVTKLQEQMAEDSRIRSVRLQQLQLQILVAGLCANVLAGIALITFYRKSITSRLKSIMSNTLRLAEGYELLPELSGADEIAQLDHSFHLMDRSLKEAAERERALFENASDVICVLDEELKFSRINPACRKQWGYGQEDLLLHSVSVVLGSSEENKSAAMQQFAKAREANEKRDIELSVYKANGERVETLWSSYFSEVENSLYCVVHDITERKQFEQNKHAFISLMSSDLRQPLFKISDDINTLLGALKNELSEKAITRLQSVKANGSRLLALVNELLQLTDASSEQKSPDREECSVEPILQRAVSDLEGMAQKYKVRFEIKCEAKRWYVDPNKIIQVLVNLGSNAIKFSPAGSTITILASEANSFTRVSIIDQGRGIPESHQKSIFEKFKQVQEKDGKAKAGTGLGLPICKEIIENNGGSINVISEEGKGSEFYFLLPTSEEIFKSWDKEKKARQKEERESLALVRTSSMPVLSQTRSSAGSNLSMFQKGALLIGVPILFEMIFVCSITSLLIQTQSSRVEESRQRQITQTAYKLLDAYFSNCVTVIGVKTAEEWDEYDKLNQQIIDSGQKLKSLVKTDARESEIFAVAEKLHKRMLNEINKARASLAETGLTRKAIISAKPDRYELWAISTGLSKRLGKLIDEAERREFINPQKQEALRRWQAIALGSGFLFNLLLSLFLAKFFSRDITSRLAIQADNASRLARELPLNPTVSGSDEIAKLDMAFHETAEKLVEARKKERAILDNSRDLIFILDEEGRFLSANPAVEDTLGFGKDELRSRRIYDFIESTDGEFFANLFKAELGEVKSLEFKLTASDGRSAYMLASLSRQKNQKNLFCIAHDITARKELEQLKEEFLAVVSHDLRSPLTSMTGTAALIEEGATGEIGARAKQFLQDIIYQGEILIELINDLLDLEKIEAGKMQLSQNIFSSADGLEKACEIAQSRQYDIEIELLEALDEVPLNLEFERTVQAFSNLLTLLAARLEPGGKLTVSAELENAYVVWKIRDLGQILTETERAGFFDRQASASMIAELLRRKTANHALVSTLHLSILSPVLAYRILSAQGGTLEYQRIADQINAIIVKLPLGPAPAGSNIEK